MVMGFSTPGTTSIEPETGIPSAEARHDRRRAADVAVALKTAADAGVEDPAGFEQLDGVACRVGGIVRRAVAAAALQVIHGLGGNQGQHVLRGLRASGLSGNWLV